MTGIDIKQVRDYIVRPALERVGAYSKSAERLVIGTGLVESKYQFVAQLNGGPARGFWQMEPATCRDLWDNYIFRNEMMVGALKGMIGIEDRVASLATNMLYAAAMCRIHYRRSPRALPHADDLQGLAKMWKDVYNTHLGAGTTQKFMAAAHAAGLMSL